jgi:Zn-dependent protease with chaperone function
MKKLILATALTVIPTAIFANPYDRKQIMQAPQAEFQIAMENDFYRYTAKMKAANFFIEPDSRSQAIFERIKEQAIKQNPQAKNWNWMFFGDLQNRFNAFGGLYGKVILGSNLFDKSLFTDDELAFVISHEVVHSLKEHAREKYNLNDGSANYIALSQMLELEADFLALDLVQNANYDPKKSLGYLRKMRNFYGLFKTQQGGENASHPSIALRYDRLQEFLN